MALADFLVRRNALLGRYAFPQLRPMARMIAICIYLLLVAPIVLVLAAMHAEGSLDLRAFWRTLFIIFALLNTLFAAICGAVGGVSPRLVIEFLVFSWIGGVLAMLFALLVSTCVPRRQTPFSTTFVPVLGATLCLPYGIGLAVGWHEIFPHGAHVPFFGMEPRLFVFLSCLALYAGCWMVLGLIRRFDNERATFFSPAGAYANLAGAAIIFAGLIWHYARESPRSALLVFWCSTAGVLLLALFGSCRTWDDYLEVQGRTGKGLGWRSANRCNLVHGAGLVLLWGVLAALAELRTGVVIPFRSVVTCMTFWCVFLALWETSVACVAWTTRIHLLTGFLALLYVILPAILGAIIEAKDLVALSPVGYITVLADEKYAPTRTPLLFGVGLLAILLLPVFRRYHSLAK